MMTRGGDQRTHPDPDPASPGMRGTALSPPDTRYPCPIRATAFWAASPGAFFGAPQHKLMPNARVALTASRGCRVLKVRVAMGSAEPGFFNSGGPRRHIGLSFVSSMKEG